MKLLVLLPAILLLPQEQNEAEKLYWSMAAKLNAKTLTFKVKGVIEPMRLKISGQAWLGEENRGRLELEGQSEEADRLRVVICDGIQLKIVQGKLSWSAPQVLEFGGRARAEFARLGFVEMIDAGGGPGLDFEMRPVDFKLGVRQKWGDREAQVVEFHLQSGSPQKVTLWIDLKTRLPLKRIVVEGRGMQETMTREEYSDFVLDEKIDPAKFKLSKD